MKTVLFLSPAKGNGGIVSWANAYLKFFKSEDFSLVQVPISKDGKPLKASLINRIRLGIGDLFWINSTLKKALRDNPESSIIHTTTSGSLGIFRDILIAKIARKKHQKCILHCHYGSIPQTLKSKIWRKLLLYSFSLYDQIWVLDRASEKELSIYDGFKSKIKLTPNSIEVPELSDIPPKDYINYAFIGNVIPTKGIVELVEAFSKLPEELRLNIIGPCEQDVLNNLKERAGNRWEVNVLYHGRMTNKDVIQFIKGIDVIALPTYFPAEAFPISILEAMAAGKLVISTPRAAIPDMLTDLDGSRCGIMVEEKNSYSIINAIEWIINNKQACDTICNKAYEKVKTCYEKTVVFSLYESYYKKLFDNK